MTSVKVCSCSDHVYNSAWSSQSARESAPPVQSAAVPAEYGAVLSLMSRLVPKNSGIRPATAALNRSSGQGCGNRHQFFSGNFGGVFFVSNADCIEVCRVGLPVNNVERDVECSISEMVLTFQWCAHLASMIAASAGGSPLIPKTGVLASPRPNSSSAWRPISASKSENPMKASTW